jgi:hypothetical protein
MLSADFFVLLVTLLVQICTFFAHADFENEFKYLL